MEEVLLTEIHEVVIDPVAQLGISLLHGGSDGGFFPEGGDPGHEILVLFGEGEGFGVVGYPHIPAPVGEGIGGLGVLLVLGYLPFRVVRGNPRILAGALDDNNILFASSASERTGSFALETTPKDTFM